MSRIEIEKKGNRRAEEHMDHAVRKVEFVNNAAEPMADRVVRQSGKNEPIKSANDVYFERMLEHSRDKNLKLQLKAANTMERGAWKGSRYSVPKFRQKLPAARSSWKNRFTEYIGMSSARKTYKEADYCTIREKEALERYYSDEQGGKPEAELTGENVPNDQNLMDFVNSILSVELKYSMFTDDYLADNIHVLLDYKKKLRRIDDLKNEYPDFFNSLSEEKKIELQSRADGENDLDQLLKRHMELHGIKSVLRDGRASAELINNSRVDQATRNARKAELGDQYNTALRNFLNGRVLSNEVNIARVLIADDSYMSDAAFEEISQIYSPYEKARKACGSEMDTALEEIKKALSVRDELIGKLKKLVPNYDRLTDKDAKVEFRNFIADHTRKIRIANTHIDRYREFLDFVTGRVAGVTYGTADFLSAENHPEFTELIQLRLVGTCLGNVIRGSQLIEARKRREAGQGSAGEVEKAESGFGKRMSLDEFYGKVIEYKKRDKMCARYKELTDSAWKKYNTAHANAEAFGKKSGLIRSEGRLLNVFRAPFQTLFDNEKKLTEDGLTAYDLLAVFSGYMPAEDTPAELKYKITSIVMPLLDKLFKLAPDKLKSLECPENPDIEDPEFYERRSLAMLGQDMKSLLDRLNRWNIPITNQQYCHLIAMGNVGEMLSNDYNAFERKMTYPMGVLFEDVNLKGDALEKVADNITYPYDRNEMEEGPVKEKLDSYIKDTGIYKVHVPHQFRGGKMGKYTYGKDVDVLEAVNYNIRALISEKTAKEYGLVDPVELYKQKKELAMKNMDAEQKEKGKLRAQAEAKEKKDQAAMTDLDAMLDTLKKEKAGDGIWPVADKEATEFYLERLRDAEDTNEKFISDRYSNRNKAWKKNRHAIDDLRGRGARVMASGLAYLDGISDEESWQIYSGLTVHLEKAGDKEKDDAPSIEQKIIMSRSLERVFKKILEFDIKKFTVKDPLDILSAESFETSLLCKMVFDFHPEHLRDYERLMEDDQAGCSLNKEQMKEVWAKYMFIHENCYWFTELIPLAGMKDVTREEIKEGLSLSTETLIARMKAEKNENRKMVYNCLVNIKNKETAFGFSLGKDAGEAYEGYREKQGLGKENRAQEALDVINSRITKEKLPAEENDRDLNDEERKEKEEDEKRYREELNRRMNRKAEDKNA